MPGVARDRAEVLAAAGSRYTYSANPLAYAAATADGAERIALVGMGYQASAPAIMNGAQGRQGGPAIRVDDRPASVRRPSMTPSSPSCSRLVMASSARTS